MKERGSKITLFTERMRRKMVNERFMCQGQSIRRTRISKASYPQDK